MIGLIYNEITKIVAQRRFLVVLIIMTLIAILSGLIAHQQSAIRALPISGARDVSGFLIGSAQLLFPFLIAIIIGDIVAAEITGGTMKLLLIRPVARWKIWLSKLIGALIVSTVVVIYFALCCYVALGAGVGFGSWSAPQAGMPYLEASAASVFLRVLGLEIVSVFSVVSLFLLMSTLVESGVAAVGLCASLTVLFSIVSGIVNFVVKISPRADWLEYAFFEHWQIASHITGVFPLDNWSITGSLVTLGVWSLLFIAIGITIFQIKDIKGS